MGVKAFQRLSEYALKRGIRCLTFYAFSTENWRRPAAEVEALMRLLSQYLADLNRQQDDRNVRIRFIGERCVLNEELLRLMESVEKRSAQNDGMQLNIAINYGGRDEIVRAANACLRAGEPLAESTLENYLDTAGTPPLDLIIRTGGESRLSNFLLWQGAYAELYFCPILWPDFGPAEFEKAMTWYAGRNRRFGGV